jgi:hypothetical protein
MVEQMRYEDAKKRATHFDTIVGELPEKRAQTVQRVKQPRQEASDLCAREQMGQKVTPH